MKRDLWRMIRVISVTVSLFVLLQPVVYLFIDAAGYFLKSPSSALADVVPTDSGINLLARSISLSLAVGIAGILFGFVISLIIWQYFGKSLKYILTFLMMMILIPPYIHAQAWIFFMDRLSGLLSGWKILDFNFSGFFAAWWVLSAAYLPIPVGIILAGLDSINHESIEASIVLKKSITTLFRVIVPQLLPSLFSAINLLLILCLTDYGIPSLFSLNVFPLHVFADFSANNNTGEAFLISLPLLAIVLFCTFASYSSIRRISYTNARNTGNAVKLHWPVWFKVIIATGVLLLLMQIFIPLADLFTEIRSFTAVGQAGNEIENSLIISFFSAILCLPLSYAVSYQIAEKSKHKGLWWFILAVPFILPAPLTGIGMISFWSLFGSGPYGTLFMPVLACTARFLPLAVLVVFSQLRSLDSNLLMAAKMFQPSPAASLFKIRLPLIIRAFAAAFGIVFALSAGELGATLIVTPPGKNTLTMKIYNYLHYGASDTVAQLCLVMLFTALFAGLVVFSAYMIGRKNKRFTGGPDVR